MSKDCSESATPDDEQEVVKRLHATTDAAVWAEEFNRTLYVLGKDRLDEGWLIGWFANAIEVGRDAGKRATRSEETASTMSQFASKDDYERAMRSESTSTAWIPVSERLPEVKRGDEQLVWACWLGENGKRHVCDLWYVNRPVGKSGEEYSWEVQDEDGEALDCVGWHEVGCNRHYDEFFMPFDRAEHVIAWMPIPKPEAIR